MRVSRDQLGSSDVGVFESVTLLRAYMFCATAGSLARITEPGWQTMVSGWHARSVQIISLTNNFYTRDPRDRIYAFSGVHPCLASIEPDYNISIEECFKGATYTILCTGRNWTHEYFIYPSASPFLPSWAIDFTDIRPGSLNAAGTTFGTPKAIFNFQSQIYQADSHATFRLRCTNQGALSTAGFVLDDVAAITRLTILSPDQEGLEEFHVAAEKLIREHLETLSRNDSSLEEKIEESIVRVFTAGRFPDKTPRSMSTSELEEFVDAVDEVCWDSTFFITEQGLMGLAPPNTAIGDSIAIFATGSIPFVLRRVETEQVQGDAYIMIGGCYVDGTSDPLPEALNRADASRNHAGRGCRRRSQARVPRDQTRN